MKRLAIHHLRDGGLSQAGIARALNARDPDTPISERSVRRVLQEGRPTSSDLAGSGPAPLVRPGRPSTAEPFREWVVSTLAEDPHLATAELLRRARDQAGYQGQKSAFYDLVRSARLPDVGAEPIVRFEGVAGEYAQFDFGERQVCFADGRMVKVTIFVGRLKYSRHLHVEVVPDQKAETLVRGVVACLHVWEVVPMIWVFDNPRTVRVSRIGEPIKLHPYLGELAAEVLASVVLCTPYQPQQKGSVENGVKWVKNGFLAQRRFVDETDVRNQLRDWLEEVNMRRVSDATGAIPHERLLRERERLRDRRLPFTPAAFALRIPVTVLPTGMVQVVGTSYSVDPRKVGAPAMAHLTASTVTITINGQSCTHHRLDHCDQPQRLAEHRKAMLGAIHGERKHNTFKRECLFELGPGAQDFLEGLIHRCGPHGSWYRPVHQLFTLLEEHGDPAMEGALGACHAAGRYQVRDVVAALKTAPAMAMTAPEVQS